MSDDNALNFDKVSVMVVERAPAALTRSPRGSVFMRNLIAVLALGAGTAGAAQQGPAEVATSQAIARVQRIDRRLGAVIALDPTALEQARRVDSAGKSGPLAG